MVGDTLQPAPAPRFSRTVPTRPTPAPTVGSDARTVLADWGLTETRPPPTKRSGPSVTEPERSVRGADHEARRTPGLRTVTDPRTRA